MRQMKAAETVADMCGNFGRQTQGFVRAVEKKLASIGREATWSYRVFEPRGGGSIHWDYEFDDGTYGSFSVVFDSDPVLGRCEGVRLEHEHVEMLPEGRYNEERDSRKVPAWETMSVEALGRLVESYAKKRWPGVLRTGSEDVAIRVASELVAISRQLTREE